MPESDGYVHEALLSVGEFTLYRRREAGEAASVLVVTPAAEQPSLRSLKQLEHEYSLAADLDPAWAARPVEVTHRDGRTMLILEDPGGEPLARVLARREGQPLELRRVLRIAVGLAAALGRVHRQGLVHKDIKPANVLVDDADHVWLTGFGISSRLLRESQAAAPPEMIVGTLAYMAPEQTGRMNRSIDARSDLYSFGITLYEMLTGTLPFSVADRLDWVHCHIARQPTPPRDRAGVADILSFLTMKLLAKNAEERYQTAAAVEGDLRRCLAQLESKGRIDPFRLGRHDASDRLLISEKLYGREREIESLLGAFHRVVTDGTPALVLVSGYAGVGKSSVVNELQKLLVLPRGLFVSGKFDQYKRDIPYATLAQAFQSLVRMLLSKSEAELCDWRDALREALGQNAQLIEDLVPELKLIIGEQPQVPELPPQDAQRRFRLVFRRFIGVFARPEHPLALFLDDLQWLDAATLDLLEDLVTRQDVGHLLVIGAYRDNEVHSAHPLIRKLEAIRHAGARVLDIILAPLDHDDIGRLIADSLRCEPERAVALAQQVHDKTAGNPFFTIQFISGLADDGLLTFDHGAARWSWEPHRIHVKACTDNVVDLMVEKVNRLSINAQTALQQLACIGNSPEPALLTMLFQHPTVDVHTHLWEAVRAGLVFHSDGSYRFLHDRVREAAYSLIPAGQRAADHLRIGRLMAAHTPPGKREEAIFEIVTQLNLGATLVTSRDERDQLAELNLMAGQRAKASIAYASALSYFSAGAALLARDSWERRHELAFALDLQRAECEFLTGAPTDAEQRLVALSGRAATTSERASITCLLADLYTTVGQGRRAVAIGLDYLRGLGVDWSSHPTDNEARREYQRIWSLLGDRTLDELIALPLMRDATSLATLDVLTKVQTAAFYTDVSLTTLVTCLAVDLSLEFGNSDASCPHYAVLGRIAGPHFGDYEAGNRLARIGYELVEQRGLKRFQAKTYLIYQSVLSWTRHIPAGRDLMHRSFEAAIQTGDLSSAAYCCSLLNTNLLAAGDPLGAVQAEAERGLAFARKLRFGFAADLIAAQLALVRMLRGSTPRFGCLDSEQFNEQETERRFGSNPDLTVAEGRYWSRKLQARFLAGDYSSALEAASRAEPLLRAWTSLFETAEYHFYGALAHAAACESATAEGRQRHLDALVAHHRQLESWAASCPANFSDRASLVGAEVARVEGRIVDAEHLYEHAIRSAHTHGFVHIEGLAHEIAGRFYAARGFEKIAQTYVQGARYCYFRWDATGKVRQLDQTYPHLGEREPVAGPTSTIGAPDEQLDLATVIKVSQAVSGEIVLERLLDTLMRTALEHAGAGRGLLIVPRGEELRIVAEATTTADTIAVRLGEVSVVGSHLAESIVQFVARTGDSVILDDASTWNAFAADEYIRRNHVRSLLCLPLIKQLKLIALLYLENTLSPHVFTAARMGILKLLASQAAISLENTRLYSDLEKREAKIRRLVDANIIGIVISDPEGGIIDANDAFLGMVGYNRDDLAAGQIRLPEMTPVEWAAVTQRAVAQLKSTGSCEPFEKEYLRKDGSCVPVLVGGAAIDDRRDESVAFMLDLTERKQAEESLRQSEQQWRDVFENNPTMYFMVDSAGAILAVNPFGAEMLGYHIDELVGRPVLAVCDDSDREVVQRHVAQCLRQLGRAHSWDARKVRKDGTVLWVRETAKAVPRANGPIVLIAGEDITEQRRAADALRQAQAELAHLTRVASLGEMTASIAHEVNQPLAAVVAHGHACLRWLSASPPNVQRAMDAATRIVKDGKDAGEIVRRVRGLFNRTAAERVPLDLREVIGGVLLLLDSYEGRKQVTLDVVLDPDLPLIFADRVQLQQLLLNLTVNALEALEPISGRVKQLSIRTGRAGSDSVTIEITDNGIGLDDPVAAFEPFVTTKPEGMGLGLAISRSIVAAHNGTLSAARNAGFGVTFTVTLPIEQV